MVSIVDIANMALQKLGSAAITQLNDDSISAAAVRRVWEIIRDAELQSYPWSFARRRAILERLAAPPAWGYPRAYPLPSDFLRLLSVEGLEAGEVQREGSMLLCASPPPLKILYLTRALAPEQYDPLFVELCAARLALELAEVLTQSQAKRQQALRDYLQASKRARRVEVLSKGTIFLPEDSWLEAAQS